MSNEIKVALLAIAAFVLFYWGYSFVRGKNILSTSNIYYVEYDDIDQLQPSSPVLINGFQVGFVAEIDLKPDNYEIVIVKLDLRKDIKVPKNTRAIIKSTGFMGGKAVVLAYDRPCTGSGDCATSGDFLEGGNMGLLDSMVGDDSVDDYLDMLKNSVGDIIDTLNEKMLSEDAEGPLAESLRSLETTMANLEASTGRLNRLMASSSDDISSTLANMESITGNLSDSNEKISRVIDNVETISADLAEADLKATLAEVDASIKKLNSTLSSADTALSGVALAIDRINTGEGTLGKLLGDDELYYRLNRLSIQTDSLVEDFQDRPYRYMPFKSRKKVQKYDRKDAKAAANN